MPELDPGSSQTPPPAESSDDLGGDFDLGSTPPGTQPKPAGGGGGGGGFAQQYQQSLASVYFNLWGVPPPPGYVERISGSHMNVFEFEAHERAKPAFTKSLRYQEERLQAELQLARFFGGLG